MPRVLLTGFCAVPGPRRAGVQLRHVIRALTPLHTVDLLVVREGDQALRRAPGLGARAARADATRPICGRRSRRSSARSSASSTAPTTTSCTAATAGAASRCSRRATRLGYAVVYDLDALAARRDRARSRARRAVRPRRGGVPARRRSRARADAGRGEGAAGPRQAGARDAVAARRRCRSLRLGRSADRRPAADPLRRLDRSGPRRARAGPRDGRDRRARSTRGSCSPGRCAPKFEPAAARRHPRARPRRQGRGRRRRSITISCRRCSRPRRCAWCPPASDLTPNPTVVLPDEAARVHGVQARDRRAAPRDRAAGRRERPRGAAVRARRSDRSRAQGAAPARRAAAARADRDRTPTSACAATSPRARRGARCARRTPCSPSGSRASSLDAGADDAPKIEILSDDDFEATVFEEAPAPPPRRHRAQQAAIPLEDALHSLGDERRHRQHEQRVGDRAAAPREPDETMERAPVAARTRRLERAGRCPRSPRRRARRSGRGHDDWVVTNVAAACVRDDRGRATSRAQMRIEDGTPVEGGRSPRRRAAADGRGHVRRRRDRRADARRRARARPRHPGGRVHRGERDARPARAHGSRHRQRARRRSNAAIRSTVAPASCRSSRWSICCSASGSR